MPPGTHGAGTVAENQGDLSVEQLHPGLLGRAQRYWALGLPTETPRAGRAG
jgi:hypothetical protein